MPPIFLVTLLIICAALLLFFLAQGPFVALLEKKACRPYGQTNRNVSIKSSAEEIRMIILGDTGFGNDDQRTVARAIENAADEKGCDLVLLAGDNFPQVGIQSVHDAQLETKFEAMYRLQVPFYAVLGNHDFEGNWKAQIDYTKMSDRWNMPASDYTLEAGPVCVSAVNTACTIRSIWPLYRKSKKSWHLALGHHPIVSTGHHGGMLPLERYLIAKSGIDFYVSGHNHALEHLEYRGVHQITSGAGGSNIHPKKNDTLPWTKFDHSGFGFVWARFTRSEASFHYFNTNNEEIYQFSKRQ